MPTFFSGDVEIAYADEVSPTPTRAVPVLLIHGFASHIDMNWRATGWIRDLTSDGYRVIAIDNRGHGRSQKLYSEDAYGTALMAEDARRLLDHLEIPRAFVIGYSMGARITAMLALAHPERVVRAVFGGLGHNMVRPMAGTGPIAHALRAPSIDDVSNPTARTFRAFAEQTGSDLLALAACIRAIRTPITSEQVGALTVPVMVAVGTDDVIGGPAAPLADLIPGAEAFEIPGRDHMKAVGDTRFKDAVRAFLDRDPSNS